MRIKLICSESHCRSLQELLKSRGIINDPTGSICILEKGFTMPEVDLVITFEPSKLDALIDFFDQINDGNDGVKEKGFIVAKRSGNFEVLQTEEILYFEADGNFIYCQTLSGRLEIRKKLYTLEKELVEKGFVRVNKSLLLNVLAIREIIPWFGGRLLLKLKSGSKEIEVSRNYVRSFKEFLGM